jgi:hypothetical protein
MERESGASEPSAASLPCEDRPANKLQDGLRSGTALRLSRLPTLHPFAHPAGNELARVIVGHAPSKSSNMLVHRSWNSGYHPKSQGGISISESIPWGILHSPPVHDISSSNRDHESLRTARHSGIPRIIIGGEAQQESTWRLRDGKIGNNPWRNYLGSPSTGPGLRDSPSGNATESRRGLGMDSGAGTQKRESRGLGGIPLNALGHISGSGWRFASSARSCPRGRHQLQCGQPPPVSSSRFLPFSPESFPNSLTI